MLAHLRTLPSRSVRSWSTAANSRCFSVSAATRAAEESEVSKEFYDDSDAGPSSREDPQYVKWLNSEGKQFKHPHRPRNWLGGKVPFPLNPSFKPPTPVSDELRTLMYTQYMANPAENGVRQLSERYGLSIKRVDAILRLKGLEDHWKKGKQLQTGFQVGMEQILGATQDRRLSAVLPNGAEVLGEDAVAADLQYDADGNNDARNRYQRMFWEPVVEGKEPIMPGVLEKAKETAKRYALKAEAEKSDAKLLSETHDKSEQVKLVAKDGRPAMKFVDVGGKFIDVQDRLRRIKESERRAKVKARRREQKEEAHNSSKATLT